MRSFILILFLLFSEILSAQNFDAGIRMGFCGSQVNGDNLSGFDKVGLIGGAFVRRKLTENIALQMEMVFIQKGSRKPTDDFNNFYRLRVHYIEVPLLLLYNVSKKITFTGGPSFGTLIFSAEDDQFGLYRNSIPFKKYELAGNGGLIYKISDNWAFDARYSHSISTIRPFPGASLTFFDKGQYNVLIEFSLLYGF